MDETGSMTELERRLKKKAEEDRKRSERIYQAELKTLGGNWALVEGRKDDSWCCPRARCRILRGSGPGSSQPFCCRGSEGGA